MRVLINNNLSSNVVSNSLILYSLFSRLLRNNLDSDICIFLRTAKRTSLNIQNSCEAHMDNKRGERNGEFDNMLARLHVAPTPSREFARETNGGGIPLYSKLRENSRTNFQQLREFSLLFSLVGFVDG